MKSTVNIGLIGLGRRGFDLLEYDLSKMRDVCVRTVCDERPDRFEKVHALYRASAAPAPRCETDYHRMLQDPDIDCVIVATAWNQHIPIAIDSLRAGKYTAIEVGCAYDLSECWELLSAYKSTGAPLMMLENCC